MKQYLDTLKSIYENGTDRIDRTGTGRRAVFGQQMRFDVSDGTLPVVTTRKIFTRGMIEETLWFLTGSLSVKELQEKGVKIWDLWEVKEEDIEKYVAKHASDDVELADQVREFYKNLIGSVGPMYGAMWRNAPQNMVHIHWPKINLEDIPKEKLQRYTEEFEEHKFLSGNPETIGDFETYASNRYYETVDQINNLVINLRDRPFSSRHVVVAWVPTVIPFETVSPQENVLLGKGALSACHAMFQCFVHEPKEEGGKKRLSLMMTQRSADFPIGIPYNIAQYSLLLHMLAHVSNMEPYEFIHSIGDTHIYLNQLEFVPEQLSREPLPLPKIWLNPEVKSIFDFTIDDIKILDYQSHPAINYPVSM